MTITIRELSDYTTCTEIAVYIGDHTVASHIIFEYKKNAIKELFEDVKKIARELKSTTHPNLVIGRGYTKDDIHRLNFKLETEYKRKIEEFKNIVENLPFLKQEQVTLSQMNAFTSIANLYGRHGSDSYLEYKDVREAVSNLERIKKELLTDNDGLTRIVI